ncbi:mechanosensitive ion channel family protein [Alkalispirochaeta alkalica]|uniref:mechanosensitive ion channel family protein n=1 Tax=Alkalispirochaeta alkalica TaxID=46356 RepID=UPI00036C22BB|nr:mechanosensitive ion channel domain-containing protein [Alkalispirochaeta alkalica]
MNELVELPPALPPLLLEPLRLGVLDLPFSTLQLVLEFFLPLVLLGGLLRILFLVLRGFIRGLPASEAIRDRAERWVHRITRLAWIASILLLASRLLGAEMARWVTFAVRTLNQPFFQSGGTSISVVTLLLVIPVFYFAGWFSRLARQSVEQGLMRHLNLDAARAFSLLSVVRFSAMGLAIVVGLSVIGINLSSLAVLFGVLGIGVGFGLQDVVANSFAGIIIVLTRPIKEGDRILVGSIEGTVQQIKFIHTIVNTVTNETLIIPNSEITSNAMHNYSYNDLSILLLNTVQVSYSTDLDQAGEVLLEVGRRCPFAVPGKEPLFRVISFDDSGITLRLGTWIRDARERMPASSWCNLEIWRAFRKEGIEIPFPQMDLHVRSAAGGQPMAGGLPGAGEGTLLSGGGGSPGGASIGEGSSQAGTGPGGTGAAPGSPRE